MVYPMNQSITTAPPETLVTVVHMRWKSKDLGGLRMARMAMAPWPSLVVGMAIDIPKKKRDNSLMGY